MVLLEGLGPQFPLEPESTLFPCVRSVSTSVQLSSQFYPDVLDWMLIGPGADRVLRLKTTTISLGSVVLRWKGSCPHSPCLERGVYAENRNRDQDGPRGATGLSQAKELPHVMILPLLHAPGLSAVVVWQYRADHWQAVL